MNPNLPPFVPSLFFFSLNLFFLEVERITTLPYKNYQMVNPPNLFVPYSLCYTISKNDIGAPKMQNRFLVYQIFHSNIGLFISHSKVFNISSFTFVHSSEIVCAFCASINKFRIYTFYHICERVAKSSHTHLRME